jgi:hypothetical protein
VNAPAKTTGEFRRLWKDHYGQDITEEQAEAYEERLIRLFKLLIDIDIEANENTPPDAMRNIS